MNNRLLFSILALFASLEAAATTFTLQHSETNGYADPGSFTLDEPNAEGNLLIAICSVRSGTGHSAHTLVDDNSNTWVKRIGHDQEIGDANARQSVSVWTHIATSTDASGTIVVTCDDGTSDGKRLTIAEFQPSASYDFVFSDESSADTGTGSTSPQGSGSTSASGQSDTFAFGLGAWRNGTGAPGLVAFTNLDGADTVYSGGDNGLVHAFSFYTTGQASAAESTDVSWTGTGHEMVAGILTFTATAPSAGSPLPIIIQQH